ncbi:hypothetical protein [Methanocalculus sp.]|uniref:hypothetical protein n=1 Tax=Methanocalculus sp. TaxID=2004547 RepID=UPI0026136B93|nr:hypothetical protein [Methanocalculus sp.]MDG6250625.1 hypothetical protein [Methanocalculus sp.]
MGFMDEIFGLIIAIVMVILFFFWILPQIASALGQESGLVFLVGIILLVVFIIAIFAMLGNRIGGRGGL